MGELTNVKLNPYLDQKCFQRHFGRNLGFTLKLTEFDKRAFRT